VPPYNNVYLDIVFLINFIMDFFILWAAAKLGRFRTTVKRLFLGAFIGACYALMIFVPNLSFITTFFAKFLCSLLMVLVAYGLTNFRRFLKSAAYFYLVSFIMGGAVLGSMYLFDNNPDLIETWNGVAVNVINFETAWLLVGLAIAIILGLWGASYIRRNLQQGPWLVSVKIQFFDVLIEAEALVDTGNQLIDPISKEPVMVVEHKKLASILPPELIDMLEKKVLPPLDQLINTLVDPHWRTRLRLIPFASLGNQHGMLIGFKPDKVKIRDGDKVYVNSEVIVAIYHRRLCSQGTYQALVHPEMLTSN